MKAKRGLLLVLSGPSGVGKGTVRTALMADHSLNLVYSISMTTRGIRKGEENGREYYFVSRDQFKENIEKGNFLEWAEFVGNFYGTPKDKVEELLEQGKNVLLEIDINGAKQVVQKMPEAITIFLVPPSMEVLEKRIRGRSTETEDIIKLRLAKAESEMKLAGSYKHVVCNDDIERAKEEIASIIKSGK